MKRLILPACAAALFHALFFLMPMPPAPVPPSASSPGTTITVTMAAPSRQGQAVPKPTTVPTKAPVQEKPKQKKPAPPKKKRPKRVVKKQVVKKKRKIVAPVKKVVPPVAPDAVAEPTTAPEEPVSADEVVAVAQEPPAEPAKRAEPAPAVGGTRSAAQPSATYAPEPRYPKTAIRRGYEGVVLLDILVNGDGHVEKVVIQKSCGHKVLDRSAVKGVKKWRFSATGCVTSVWVTLPVRFELHGR